MSASPAPPVPVSWSVAPEGPPADPDTSARVEPEQPGSSSGADAAELGVGKLPNEAELGGQDCGAFVAHLLQNRQGSLASEKVVNEAAKASQQLARATMIDGLDGHEKMIQAAAEQGDGKFDMRKALGQLFSRSAGQSAEYKLAKGHTAKATFRAEWAAAKWKSIEEDHMHVQTHLKSKTVKGTYVCFAKILEHEGGKDDPAAWLAAAKYGSKCLTMGAPWTAYNSMTERVDYMLIQRSEEDVFTEAWSHTRSGVVAPAAIADAPSATAGTPVAAVVETPQKAARGQKRPAGGDPKEAGGPSQVVEAKGGKQKETPQKPGSTSLQKEVTKALAELAKTKAKFASASSSMRTLMERITSTPSWQWANTETLTKKLNGLKIEEKNFMADEFTNEVMTSDVAELRKSIKDEGALLQSSKKFNTEFGILATSMEKEVKILMHMHRLQADNSA
jgi:Arc/MetJ-type ribon-helix-helix transcriptional regulator